MSVTRILALSAAALVGVGLLAAPPASAASQTITVDCLTGDVGYLTVTPGDEITFSLDDSCKTILNAIANPDITSSEALLATVSPLADLNGTGGSLAATYDAAGPWLVIYTAGPRAGTDSLVLEAVFAQSARLYRIAPQGASYYMTVPGAAGPAPWPQAIGRPSQDAPCPASYSPSWAKWPNGGTGGWVCVREYYYNSTLGDWSYRRG